MNWQEIRVSADNTHFLYNGKPIFEKYFIEVLKYHFPGLAPVKDKSGAFHINVYGNQLYHQRYQRTFGYYCNRAAVMNDGQWFHINENGERIYSDIFSWIGNFQENICTVRDDKNRYFHIDPIGNRIYPDTYVYCGDFKDGYACVKKDNGFWRHVNIYGNRLNDKEFLDLNIFHKNFATAKDKNGWHHIDKSGNEIYSHRFLLVEPFYNGFALVTKLNNEKIIIDENGMEAFAI